MRMKDQVDRLTRILEHVGFEGPEDLVAITLSVIADLKGMNIFEAAYWYLSECDDELLCFRLREALAKIPEGLQGDLFAMSSGEEEEVC